MINNFLETFSKKICFINFKNKKSPFIFYHLGDMCNNNTLIALLVRAKKIIFIKKLRPTLLNY